MFLVRFCRLPRQLQEIGVSDAAIAVHCLDTRNATADAASAAIAKACSGTKAGAFQYLKIDSTLRGPIAASMAAMMNNARCEVCLFAPAFPGARDPRTTIGGHQLVNGMPCDRWMKDPVAPVASSYLPDLFAPDDNLDVKIIGLEYTAEFVQNEIHLAINGSSCKTVLILDAASDEDLFKIAMAYAELAPSIGRKVCLAGSAGLSSALAATLFSSPGGRPTLPPMQRKDGPIVVISGTAQPVTVAQMGRLRSSPPSSGASAGGRLVVADLDPGAAAGDVAAADVIVADLATAPGANATTTTTTTTTTSAAIIEVADTIAAQMSDMVGGIVVTGGATAQTFMSAVGAGAVDVRSEVLPGVVLGIIRGGRLAGTPVITKSGALGGPEALVEAAHALLAIPTAAPTAAPAAAAAAAGPARTKLAAPPRELQGTDPRVPGVPGGRKLGTKPVVAITVGDVCGVGPEIIVKALGRPEIRELANFVIIGLVERMELAAQQCFGAGGPSSSWSSSSSSSSSPTPQILRVDSIEACRYAPNTIEVFCPFAYDLSLIETGKVCPEAGRCAALFVKAACRLALAGTVDAIATAPLNKAAMHAGGFVYGGHTELIQECCGADSSRLCLTSDKLTVVHATCHVPFREIVDRMADEGRILETIKLVHEFSLMRWPDRAPRIAVAGLNPHCEPIFGDEETRIIAPAIREAHEAYGIACAGPIPPDTVFLRASQGEFDTVVAMYHDQGHIPSKIAGFGDTVNVTLGLPIIRTRCVAKASPAGCGGVGGGALH